MSFARRSYNAIILHAAWHLLPDDHEWLEEWVETELQQREEQDELDRTNPKRLKSDFLCEVDHLEMFSKEKLPWPPEVEQDHPDVWQRCRHLPRRAIECTHRIAWGHCHALGILAFMSLGYTRKCLNVFRNMLNDMLCCAMHRSTVSFTRCTRAHP